MSETRIKCPECGKEVTKNKAILTCPNCGMTFCSKCMEQQPKGAQRCSSCGAEIVKKQAPKVNPRPNDNTNVPKPSGEIQTRYPDPKPSPSSGPYRAEVIKISDLAKEIRVSSGSICDYLRERRYGDYSPESKISDFIANEVRKHFQKRPAPQQPKQPYPPKPQEKSWWDSVVETVKGWFK